MVWDESAGVVSHSFDEWKATDSEIRTYLALSLKWVQAAYDNAFGAAEREFSQRFDPDTDDPDGHVGYFEDEVAGLWPRDFFWMLRSGALRDAVTAFEVYAEKSILELLSWYRFEGTDGETYRVAPTVSKNQMSPSWPTLRRIHEALGNDIETRTSSTYLSCGTCSLTNAANCAQRSSGGIFRLRCQRKMRSLVVYISVATSHWAMSAYLR